MPPQIRLTLFVSVLLVVIRLGAMPVAEAQACDNSMDKDPITADIVPPHSDLQTDSSVRSDEACSRPDRGSIVADGFLDKDRVMWVDEAMHFDFTVSQAHRSQQEFCPWSATLFNGDLAMGSCEEFGRCQLQVDDTLVSPMMNLMLVISSPRYGSISKEVLSSCYRVYELELCQEQGGNCGENWHVRQVEGCERIVSMYQLKINFHRPDHLAPALSLQAVGFVTGSEVGARRHSLANEYDVNDEASLLFDPIVSTHCEEITIVSPLRSQDTMTDKSGEEVAAWENAW